MDLISRRVVVCSTRNRTMQVACTQEDGYQHLQAYSQAPVKPQKRHNDTVLHSISCWVLNTLGLLLSGLSGSGLLTAAAVQGKSSDVSSICQSHSAKHGALPAVQALRGCMQLPKMASGSLETLLWTSAGTELLVGQYSTDLVPTAGETQASTAHL